MAFWFVVPVAFSGYTVAAPLFTRTVLGWRERELGWLFAIVGVTAATVQGYFFGRLSRRFSDRTLLIAGAAGMAIAIAAMPFQRTSAMVYAWTFALAFSNSMAAPAATGLVSKFAAVSEQGTMLGAAQAISALGRVGGPVMTGQVYDLFGARAAFLAAAAIMLVACGASFRVAHPDPAPAPAPDMEVHPLPPSAT
jgi:MFS family permease